MHYKPIHKFLSEKLPELPAKEFDIWNEQKKNIDQEKRRLVFRRREIWWCRLGLNIGYEQDGKGNTFRRPVLILKKLSHNIFIGIPITTKTKEGNWFQKFSLSNGEQRIAIIGQMRTFDTRRLIKHLDTISPLEFFTIVKAVQNLIEPLTSSSSQVSLEDASLGIPPEADVWSLYQEWNLMQEGSPQGT